MICGAFLLFFDAASGLFVYLCFAHHRLIVELSELLFILSSLTIAIVALRLNVHPTMQFEPPLGDTFYEYRKATNDLVQWIASTARATGTLRDLFDKAEPTVSPSLLQKLKDKRAASLSLIQKLKGKRRAQAKTTGNTTSQRVTEISYKTLGRFGKAIASSEDIEVPYNVLVILKGIIHARKGFAT